MARIPFWRSAGGSCAAPAMGAAASEPAAVRVPLGLRYPWKRMVVGLVVLVLVSVLASSQGSVTIPPLEVAQILVTRLPLVEMTPTWPDAWETILWKLRLPRIVLAGLVGASLAMAGATYQGMFRNPLADPFLIGVASGAGLGATIVLVTGVPHQYLGFSLLPLAAFVGAVAAVSAAYAVARSSQGLPLTTLILAGIAIAYLLGAAMSLLMLRSDPELRPVLSWLLGSLKSAQWNQTLMVALYLVPSLAVVLSYGRVLNVLQLDEEHARQLGVNLERTKLLLLGTASLATAAAVAFTGPIGFVGLVAPHAVRLVWGVDYRSLLPMAAIVGATFLVLADLAARTAAGSAELPVGVVTAFCGAPFFLYLLRRRGPIAM